MRLTFLTVCARGPRAARWERLWAVLGETPARVDRLEEVTAGPRERGLILVDAAALAPRPASALAALRARAPHLFPVACVGPDLPPGLAEQAVAAGALDLFPEEGADESLAERLRRHVKRLFPRQPGPGRAEQGPLRLDRAAREVSVRRGKAWRRVDDLTAREFDVLAALVAAGGRPLTREELLAPMDEEASPAAVDKALAGLRRKLGPAGRLLKTLRKSGYFIAI